MCKINIHFILYCCPQKIRCHSERTYNSMSRHAKTVSPMSSCLGHYRTIRDTYTSIRMRRVHWYGWQRCLFLRWRELKARCSLSQFRMSLEMPVIVSQKNFQYNRIIRYIDITSTTHVVSVFMCISYKWYVFTTFPNIVCVCSIYNAWTHNFMRLCIVYYWMFYQKWTSAKKDGI